MTTLLDPRPFLLVGGFFCFLLVMLGLFNFREAGIISETFRLIATVILFISLAYFAVNLFEGRY